MSGQTHFSASSGENLELPAARICYHIKYLMVFYKYMGHIVQK